jgi:hypothetical protein
MTATIILEINVSIHLVQCHIEFALVEEIGTALLEVLGLLQLLVVRKLPAGFGLKMNQYIN